MNPLGLTIGCERSSGSDNSQSLTISELTIGQESSSASGFLCVHGKRAAVKGRSGAHYLCTSAPKIGAHSTSLLRSHAQSISTNGANRPNQRPRVRNVWCCHWLSKGTAKTKVYPILLDP